MDDSWIIWADETLVIVDKPSGMPSQRTKGNESGLYEALQERYAYVGLHHRLDQPASGLVLFTLNPAANVAIAKAFQSKTIERSYRAVFAGRVEQSLWKSPMQGKSARTHILSTTHGMGMSACEVQLSTGRKHQIRLHAALHNHPIVGDRRYGQQWGGAWPRLALQAYRLALRHPISGKRIEVEQPICPTLRELWCKAGRTD